MIDWKKNGVVNLEENERSRQLKKDLEGCQIEKRYMRSTINIEGILVNPPRN